jgi:hypothetical protein
MIGYHGNPTQSWQFNSISLFCIKSCPNASGHGQEHNLGLSRKHFFTAYELVVAKHYIPQLLGMVMHGQIVELNLLIHHIHVIVHPAVGHARSVFFYVKLSSSAVCARRRRGGKNQWIRCPWILHTSATIATRWIERPWKQGVYQYCAYLWFRESVILHTAVKWMQWRRLARFWEWYLVCARLILSI